MSCTTWTRRAGAALAVGALALAACSGGSSPGARPSVRTLPDLTLAATLTSFDSCPDLLGWVRAEARARVGPWGLGDSWYGGVATADVLAAEDASAASARATAPTAPAYSSTNVQVAGVDEPDVVKSDGERLVVLVGGTLRVVDVSGAAPVARGTLALDGNGAGELLVDGDRALVLAPRVEAEPDPQATRAGTELAPYGSASVLTEVDLRDPDRPRVVARLTIEGRVLTARMVGGVVRVVVRSEPWGALGFVAPAAPGRAAEERATRVNREVIDESTIDDWLPAYELTDAAGEVQASGRLLDCDRARRPQGFSGFGALTVMTVDLADGLTPDPGGDHATAVMAGGEVVYASTDHLYVATDEYVDWDRLDEQARRTIERDYGTAIHRFAIDDPDTAVYEGSGRVDGHLLDQFSLDERDGLLRVATTAGSPWSTGADTSESRVAVLALRDGALVTIGAVGDLGRGETIHSVRFLDDRGYVVTFRQTDPLYVVDLHDPTAPVVHGELALLGYSAYLHPVGDGFLLGIGQDATDQGARLGAQASLFDVRDPARPRLVARVPLAADGTSAVEWDHRAFLWWAPSDLAVVPVQTYRSDGSSGAIALDVDPTGAGLQTRGRVTQPGAVVRSLVVGDALYTLSDAGLLRSGLQDLEAGAWLPFS